MRSRRGSRASARPRRAWTGGVATRLVHDVEELPVELAERCVRFVRSYELLFGAVDFAVDQAGRYVFSRSTPTASGAGSRVERLLTPMEGCAPPGRPSGPAGPAPTRTPGRLLGREDDPEREVEQDLRTWKQARREEQDPDERRGSAEADGERRADAAEHTSLGSDKSLGSRHPTSVVPSERRLPLHRCSG